MSEALHTVEIPFQRRFMRLVNLPGSLNEWAERALDPQTTFFEKLGLLHHVFDVELGRRPEDPYKFYGEHDRLAILFDIADGWTHSSNFDWRTQKEKLSGYGYRNDETTYFVGYERGMSGGRRAHRTKSEQRQVLARKAFDLLCMNFFRHYAPVEHVDAETEAERMWEMLSGEMYPLLVRFFRIEEDESSGVVLCNLTPLYCDKSDNEKHAIRFLLKLAKYLWGWRCTVERDRANAARLWLIEVLNCLGELKFFDKQERLLGLDEPCLVVLTGIALRAELGERQDQSSVKRRPATIEEACYADSFAAALLLKRQVMVGERDRLHAIYTAKQAAEEARRRFAELTEQK